MPLPDTTPSERPLGRAIVLLSGGLDSATALAVAVSEGLHCHTLAFDYGQRHRHELTAAERVSQHLGAISHRVVHLDPRPFAASALTSDLPVPKGRSAESMASGIPVTYVPARNLVFLSLATALAESLGCTDIVLGINAIDYSGYPDCRPEFVKAFQNTVALATKAGIEGRGPRIRAPLVHLSKAGIIQLGTSLGVDYSMTHSCYDPIPLVSGEVLACAECDSCRLRRAGFAEAAVADPTLYASKKGTALTA